MTMPGFVFEGGSLQPALDALDTLQTRIPRALLDVIAEAEHQLVQRSRRNLLGLRAVDTGVTFQNIVPVPPRLQGSSEAVGAVRAGGAAARIEEGRRPGSRMPPGAVLLGWMARHGIPSRAEYPIRRAIAQRGIPARPFMGPAAAEVLAGISTLAVPTVEQLIRSVDASLRGGER